MNATKNYYKREKKRNRIKQIAGLTAVGSNKEQKMPMTEDKQKVIWGAQHSRWPGNTMRKVNTRSSDNQYGLIMTTHVPSMMQYLLWQLLAGYTGNCGYWCCP